MKFLSTAITLFLFTLTAVAQSGNKKGSFEAPGLDELRIIIDAGMHITIEGSEGSNQISYTYEFDGNDQAYKRYFENFDPKFEKQGGQASLEINFPEHKKRNVNFRVKKNELVLKVPSQSAIILGTRYSKIDISNFEKGVEVANRSGSVKVSTIGQGVSVDNDFGDISLEAITGDVYVQGRSSRVDIQDIEGHAEIEAIYSKMNISEIDGNVNIKNRSGAINAFNIRGSLTAESDYTELELTNIDGDVQLRSKSGKLDVDKARSLQFYGHYTNVHARNINSSEGVLIESRSSKVSVENIDGPTKVYGQYLDIDLKKIRGEIDIKNRSGKVTGRELKGSSFNLEGEYVPITLSRFEGGRINIVNRSADMDIEAVNQLDFVYIESQYGDVDLRLGAPFAGKVELTTTYGKLDSNLRLNNVQVKNEGKTDSISGEIGNGNGSMTITLRNGDIIIR